MTTYSIADLTELVKGELDWPYVEAVAEDVAAALWEGAPMEACFQPGDGTRYDLVFVPLQGIAAAPPRVKDGETWSRTVAAGIDRDRGTALVAYLRHGAAGLDFRSGGFGGGYLAGLFGVTDGSGCALALLFNEVSARFVALAPRAA